jgi:hypothetical protein
LKRFSKTWKKMFKIFKNTFWKNYGIFEKLLKKFNCKTRKIFEKLLKKLLKNTWNFKNLAKFWDFKKTFLKLWNQEISKRFEILITFLNYRRQTGQKFKNETTLLNFKTF